MKKIISKNPVLSFIAVTLLYSWTLWLLMILSNKGLLPFKFPTNFLGSFGPAVGAITVILVSKGKLGFKEFVSRLFPVSQQSSHIKTNIWNYIFALLFIVLVTFLSVLILSVLNDVDFRLGKVESLVNAVLYFVIIFFLGGPFGEELGWRGFLQPELHKKHNPFVATLIIAGIWFLWHLPLFWLEGAAQKGSSILNFAVLVTCMSFLFTWLYIKSSGCLFLALIFHTSINYFTAYINPMVLPFISSSSQFDLIFTICIVIITIGIVSLSRKHFFYKL